ALGRRRLEGVGRAGGAGAGAGLRLIAGACGHAALDRRRLEGIGGAVVGDTVAALRDVTGCRGGATDARALRVGRAEPARSGADFRHVAVARRGTALGAGRHEDVRGAVVRDAVAALGDVARAGDGAADGRALLVGRASGVRAGAELGDVAVAGGGAALGRRRLDGVGGAGGAGAGAELGDVARPRGRPAQGGRRLELAGRRAAVTVDGVPVVALLAGLDDTVAAARAGHDRVDDVGDRIGKRCLVGD